MTGVISRVIQCTVIRYSVRGQEKELCVPNRSINTEIGVKRKVREINPAIKVREIGVISIEHDIDRIFTMNESEFMRFATNTIPEPPKEKVTKHTRNKEHSKQKPTSTKSGEKKSKSDQANQSNVSDTKQVETKQTSTKQTKVAETPRELLTGEPDKYIIGKLKPLSQQDLLIWQTARDDKSKYTLLVKYLNRGYNGGVRDVTLNINNIIVYKEPSDVTKISALLVSNDYVLKVCNTESANQLLSEIGRGNIDSTVECHYKYECGTHYLRFNDNLRYC